MTQCSNARSGRLSSMGFTLAFPVDPRCLIQSTCHRNVGRAFIKPPRVDPPRALHNGSDRKPHLQNQKSLAVLGHDVRNVLARSCEALERILVCSWESSAQPLAAGAGNTLP